MSIVCMIWSRRSFGNCTSLRPHDVGGAVAVAPQSQFLRELHFIEAPIARVRCGVRTMSQFLRELHFIEALLRTTPLMTQICRSSFGNCTSLRREDPVPRRNPPGRSSFGNCTSLRRLRGNAWGVVSQVAVPSGTALH